MYSGGDEPVWHILEVGEKNTTKTRRLLPLDALQEWSYNVIHRPHRCKQEVSRWHNSCFCYSSVHLLSTWKPPKSSSMTVCMYVYVTVFDNSATVTALPAEVKKKKKKMTSQSFENIVRNFVRIEFLALCFTSVKNPLRWDSLQWCERTWPACTVRNSLKRKVSEPRKWHRISDGAVCVTMTRQNSGSPMKQQENMRF